jgi:23S rRNA (guanosine2251-2'-O)-methyltransferase
MKPPHSGRPGGSGRPPSDHGPRRPQGPHPQGPRPPGQGPRPHGQGPRPEGSQARPAHGERPASKSFQARPAHTSSSQGSSHQGSAHHGQAPRGAGEYRRPRTEPAAPRPPDVPRGTVWIYGQHAVAAALANPARRLRRLLLTEEAEQSLAQRLRQPWSLQPERTERARIDHLLGRDVVHQGAALLADLLPTPSLQHALERRGPLLVLDQVTDPRNVGAILRSAAAFGVAAVINQDRNAPEETGSLAKAASGALETVPLLRAVNIARTLIALKAAGCWVVGLDAGGGNPLSGPALAERRAALVLGAEGDGLRRLTRETCDEVAGLTIPGAMESLNVSAAAAVALYELTRRA